MNVTNDVVRNVTKASEKQLEPNPVHQNKLEMDTYTLQIVHEIFFPMFKEVADILEGRKIRKKVRDQILRAETFSDVDELIRVMAAQCYEIAENFGKRNKRKEQLKWIKLVARFLQLSIEPKKLVELEKIKRELARIKREQAAL